MKDSGGDWSNMKSVLEAIPGFKLYSGTEKYFLDVLRAGGAGVISATTNLTGNLAALVYSKRDEPDAENLQAKLTEARQAFEGPSFVSSVKHELAKWHQNENWLHIRPPNSNLSASQVTELENRLKAIDFETPSLTKSI
jgi:4-hydroxy-tetrahydrodipicolinate synthase